MAGDEETRKSLKGLRNARTKRRNAARADIASVDDLNSSSPVFPNGQQADQFLVTMTQHVARIRELDQQIGELLGEDEIEAEADAAEDFHIEIDRGIAAVKAAIRPAAPQMELPTFYGTPEGVRHVHFRPNLSSTMSAPPHIRRKNREEEDPPTGLNQSSPDELRPTSSQLPPSTATRLARELDISPEVFSGDRLYFRAFITQFKCFVGKRPEASPLEKLMVLRKYVSGEPRNIVHSLELTGANYQVALDLLHENYARTESDKERILSDLRNLPRIPRYSDLPALRKLITLIQGNIATLASNGIPLEDFALSLKSSIEASMPARLRQEFKDARRLEKKLLTLAGNGGGREASVIADEQTTENNSATADDDNTSVSGRAASDVRNLIEFLRSRVRDWEDNRHLDERYNSAAGDVPERQPQARDVRRRPKSTVAALAPRQSESAGGTFRPRPCLFCRTTDHNSSRCPADLSLAKRREILRAQRRCEKCFKPRHSAASDCRGPRSPCSKCASREHYTSMHGESSHSTNPVIAQPTGGTDTAAATVVQTVSGASADTGALLLTACAYVINGGVRIPIRVFLDPGSTLTVVLPALRAMLREPPVGVSNLTIQTFSSTLASERVPLFNIRIMSAREGPPIELFAHEFQFGVDPPNTSSKTVLQALARFDRKKPLADRTYVGEWSHMPPSILIGMNQLHKIMHRQLPESVIDDITAQSTELGWVIGGSVPISQGHLQGEISATHIVCCTAGLSAHLPTPMSTASKALEALWSLEAIGISDSSSKSQLSADDAEALRQFREGISYEDGRYVVTFPKHPSICNLPNNLVGAIQRLQRKISQLQHDPVKYQRYHTELMRFVNEGFAIPVLDWQTRDRSEIDGSYFMPHHEVITGSDSSERWRIVFDCSAKQRGATALNDHLLPGPNLNPDLVTLLLNFRLHPIAVSADISRAYMRIAVNPSDQPRFRFLWQAPGSNSIQAFQMQRVTWGAASSGFLLAATVRHHLEKGDSETRTLGECLYADDFLRSFENVDRATQFTDRIRQTLGSAGMSLAKWKTNSPQVKAHLLNSGVDADLFDSTASEFLKVLGISWSPSEDVLLSSTPLWCDDPGPESVPTKRQVLSIVASIYDPLGWLTPFTLRGKRLIQQLWAADLRWNDSIPEAVHHELIAWMSEVKDFRRVRLPRHYNARAEAPAAYLLHIFGDASKIAYACVAFIESRYKDGSSDFALVMSKSRLAPRDSPSLPRLELLASLIAVRLKKFLVERMSIVFERVLFYTDSMIAYHWATSTKPGNWKQFVSNRVQEIQSESQPEDWFHIKGEENISDLGTRGVSALTLTQTREWWEGPSWLRLPLGQRPISQPSRGAIALDSVNQEVRRVLAVVVSDKSLLDLQLFSTASRAVRTLANVLRFICATRRRPMPDPASLCREAESALIKWCQQQFLQEEIASVRSGTEIPGASRLAAYKLFFGEDGILRIRTRLQSALHLTYDEKNPIVIPGESRLARLLIVDAHRMNAHFGVNTILNHIRKRFWITRGRQIIKAMLRRCVVCRRRQAAAAKQIEAPLPEFRATLEAAFTTAGVDFCGPFYTRHRSETCKTYVALFTCTAVRGVHLEAVPSMTTPQTHLALRRFLASYPACRKFVSDNGTSFAKAATEIKRLFNSNKDQEVLELLSGRSVTWEFNCARAPWRGGIFERCVGILKSALAKTLGKNLIGYEEFRTILCELAAVINDRPLTHVGSEPDAPTALTPAHFLRGGPHLPVIAPHVPIDRLGGGQVNTGDDLRVAHASKSNYFKDISVRWFREYLLLLRTAVTTRGRRCPSLRIGDVCLLREDNRPRIQWRLVRIVDSHPGRDGEVRTYTVRFENRRTSRRAAQLLIPLELPAEGQESSMLPTRPETIQVGIVSCS